MGADRLDAQLEPLAQFILILIVLLVVAAATTYILTKAVHRRRDRLHGKLSGSRRTKHSKIDLLTKSDTPAASSARKRRSRSEGSTARVDILKRSAEPGEE
jgi:hypothetical protein